MKFESILSMFYKFYAYCLIIYRNYYPFFREDDLINYVEKAPIKESVLSDYAIQKVADAEEGGDQHDGSGFLT